MVSEILQYTYDNIKIRTEEADCMYSGIMIDTNNFMTKTGVRTFEAAAFLRRNGADVTRVRKLFREDAAEYKACLLYTSYCRMELRENAAVKGLRTDGIRGIAGVLYRVP